jgi:hypothetical protein
MPAKIAPVPPAISPRRPRLGEFVLIFVPFMHPDCRGSSMAGPGEGGQVGIATLGRGNDRQVAGGWSASQRSTTPELSSGVVLTVCSGYLRWSTSWLAIPV